MKRGDVYLVDFEPAIGQEIQKTRPAVIVSNDISNMRLERVQVVPITSKATKIYKSESKTIINGIEGKATASQITTVSHQRMIKKLGSLTSAEMQNIDDAIRYQLDL